MPKKLTTEEFIEKAIKIHGDKYNYSKVEYIKSKEIISIVCKKHGEFKQSPNVHLKGCGCPICMAENTGNRIRLTTKEFIKRSVKIHGNKYNYSKVEYIGIYEKIIIICKEHGKFEQIPNVHLKGCGCPKCSRNRITTEDFIEKSIKIHGEKYNYSKVEYINNREKIKIICKKHGEFMQTPNVHLKGGGCPKCYGFNKTTEDLIKQFKEIHKNKYNYSKTEYTGIKNKIIIICKKHGEFKQSPASHLFGHGCFLCGIIKVSNKNKSTNKQFIEKSVKIHGEKYDYSKVEYTKGTEKIIITCKKHGDFKQTPSNHLSGHGCLKCKIEVTGNKIKLTTKKFIEKAIKTHSNKYDYSKVKYINSKIKVIIICKKHGEFKQSPASHLFGYGCPKCGEKTKAEKCKLTTKEFIEKAVKIHRNKYNYSKTEYINSKIKVIIICKKHGEFKQSPASHLQGIGCPYCFLKNQSEVKRLLFIHYSDFEITSQKFIYNYIGADKKEHKRYCDFYLQKDEKIIIVEYDGQQHFMSRRFNGMSQEKAEKRFIIQQFIDNKDTEFCKENNILLWRIKYDDNKEKSTLRLKELING